MNEIASESNEITLAAFRIRKEGSRKEGSRKDRVCKERYEIIPMRAGTFDAALAS